MAENDDFLDGLWARVVTKYYWNYCKQHLEQLLWKFEKAVGLFFYDVIAENDDFLSLLSFFNVSTVIILIFF